MVKFDLLVCAESLIKESEKDTFSAINILEDFVAETYPTYIPKLAILLVTSKATEDLDTIEADFQILMNQDVMHSSKQTIAFLGKNKANTRMNVQTIPVASPGKLVFRFSYQSTSIEYLINLRLREVPKVSESKDTPLE